MNWQPYTGMDDQFREAYQRPLFSLFLALMGGIIYAELFPINMMWLLSGLLAIAGIVGWRLASTTHTYRNFQFIWFSLLLFMAIVGALRMELLMQEWNRWDRILKGFAHQEKLGIEGTVDEMRAGSDNYASMILSQVKLRDANQGVELPVRIELQCTRAQVKQSFPGDRIYAEGVLEPILGTQVPVPFDFGRYRRSQGIFGRFRVEKDGHIAIQTQQSWTTVRGFSYAVLDKMQKTVSKGQDESDIITPLIGSICFGIRTKMPHDFRNALQRSGLAHITSISGLHVSLILYLIAFLLKRLGLRRKHAALVTIPIGFLYLMLVGFRIPTLRAVLMAYVFMGGYLFERRVSPFNSLGLAGLIILISYPAELFLPSFQLSFTAVFFLLLYGSALSRLGEGFRYRMPFDLLRVCLASLIVVAGLAPFTIYYFNLFGLGAIIGNVFAIPLLFLLLPFTYLWALFLYMPSSSFETYLGELVIRIVEILAGLIQWIGGFASFCWSIPFPGMLPLVLIFCAMVLFSHPMRELYRYRHVRLRAYHASLVLIVGAIWFGPVMRNFQPFQVDFIALGQGDCILMETEKGRTVLVDGGSPVRNPDSYRAGLLNRYLYWRGIQRIDIMILSHPQADHIGVLKSVAEEFPVGVLIEGAQEYDSKTYHDFIQTIEEKGIERCQVQKGDIIHLEDDIEFIVLHPDEKALRDKEKINEQSVVLMLQDNGLEMLMTGDIGHETEKRLCQHFENWDVDILKVPHHGSRYSTHHLLLEETKPEVAVIQVGRNYYDHPHSQTLERLRRINALVLRTDLDGTIQIRKQDHRLRIYTWGSERLILMDDDRM